MRLIEIDATNRERTQIRVFLDSGIESEISWPTAEDSAGARLAAELKKLELSSADRLGVVRGPGYFSGIRVAAVVANSLGWLAGCELAQRKVDESDWQPVKSVEPFYAAGPRLGPVKN